MTIRSIDIRPGVSVLSVLRHLNYKPWFAIAEFVDNALQSFQANQVALAELHGPNVKLKVSIELVSTPFPRLIIRDNAAGIAAGDYARAFRAAAIPPDRAGLSEFGMGMKSAACWFAPRWRVRTKALGEPVQRLVEFNIDEIVNDELSELKIEEKPAKLDEHFTEVILEDLHHRLLGRTVGKIKEHLTDIYRVFARNDLLDLRFDGDPLRYDAPALLVAPYFRELDGAAKTWSKEVEFDFGEGLQVTGFAAIRAIGSTSRAGFALFRRGRLIQGSGDEGYRPDVIFGNSNSYRYQRVFGELHLDGFEVSHTKDGFRWDGNEQPFLDLLKEHLDSDDLPLLRQAEGHRVRQARDQLAKSADEAISSTADALKGRLQEAFTHREENPLIDVPPNLDLPTPEGLLASRTIDVRFHGEAWRISIELTNDQSAIDWLQISDKPSAKITTEPRQLGLRVSLAHPFMVRYAGTDTEDIDALLRIAAALGIAEVLTREAGYKGSSIYLQNVNDLIREALSQP